MGINPGTYNVFNEDGTLFKWGKESTRISVTTTDRINFYVGDNEEPMMIRHLPHGKLTLSRLDSYALQIFSAALVMYATRLMERLTKLQDAHGQILARQKFDYSDMILGVIPTWRWIEKFKELNTYQETCEDLMKETVDVLQDIAPDMIASNFLVIFSQRT